MKTYTDVLNGHRKHDLGGAVSIAALAGIASLIKHVYIDNVPNSMFHFDIRQHLGGGIEQLILFFINFTFLEFAFFLSIYIISVVISSMLLFFALDSYHLMRDKYMNYPSGIIYISVDLTMALFIFALYIISMYYVFAYIFIY